MKKSSNKGFTLVELIIVIAILAIIMLIAIPNFSGIQQRMQVRADKATAAQIGKAVRVWFTDYTTDDGMLATAKAQADHGAGHTTAPVAKTVSEKAFVALPVVATNAVTPVNYEKLVTIDEYISRGQKPSSLKKADKTTDPDQIYAVFLTQAATNTSAKIAVAVATAPSGTVTAIGSLPAEIDATYDGSAPAVAYVEP